MGGETSIRKMLCLVEDKIKKPPFLDQDLDLLNIIIYVQIVSITWMYFV